jgi:anoctamin-10
VIDFFFQSFSPTILFVTLIPRLMSVYHTYAVRLTNWENHRHQSTHDASLTLKTFSLSAVVAYGGLALSAFVYVPFGEQVMTFVQIYLFRRDHAAARAWATASAVLDGWASGPTATAVKNATGFGSGGLAGGSEEQLWETDGRSARSKLDPSRLQNQMFAVAVTNQVVNTFMEIGLPFVMRGLASFRARRAEAAKRQQQQKGRKSNGAGNGVSTGGLLKEKDNDEQQQNGEGGKKRVAFEDDGTAAEVVRNANGREEREFMERVWQEVALPEYTLFEDYSEMVTQFGNVALWSTIWPLAPRESLLLI